MNQVGLIIAALVTFVTGMISARNLDFNLNNTPTPSPATVFETGKKIKMMKDVGEAYMDNFGLTDSDFKNLKDAGFDVIEGNFDICASDVDIKYMLDKSEEYGLKVIMPAGSGEAEWGYECDMEEYPKDQKPIWQKNKVRNFVDKWKGHTAIYAWDISNEAGSVFPNASWMNVENNKVTDAYYINTEQLKSAYSDVKGADRERPLMIRMNGWFFFDFDTDFFINGNPFAKDVADIVMVNAYSNVEDYYPDFVPTVTERAVTSINKTDPGTEIIISLGAWEELPLWHMPKIPNLRNEIMFLDKLDILGIAYFKYGAKGSEWYLPASGDTPGSKEIWEVTKNSD